MITPTAPAPTAPANEDAAFAALLASHGVTPSTSSSSASSGWYAKLNPTATTPTSPAPTAPNVVSETASNYGGDITAAKDKIASSAAISEKAATETNPVDYAKDIGEGALGMTAGGVEAIFAPIAAPIQTLISHASQNAPGTDFANTPQMDQARQSISDWATAHPELARTLGDAFTVGTAAIGGGAAGEGLNASLSDIATGAKDAVVKGVGAVKDAATSAKEAIVGTPEEQAAKQATTEAEQATKDVAKNQAGVLENIRETEDTMTPTQKKAAIADGRQTISTTKLGGTKVDYTPTPEIERASQILSNEKLVPSPVKPDDAPNVVFAKTENAISTLGAKAEKYLEANPVKITNNEDLTMFDDMKAKAAKSSTATEMNAYNEQIQLFEKQLLGRPGGYTTANYYKALKDYETSVASKMARGKDALIDPTGVASAKIQAASDIRHVVRDLIGSKHPAFKPQMYDLTSLYDARDVAIQNASKIKSQTFLEKHPNVKTAAKVGAGLIGADLLGKGVGLLH